MNALTGAGHSKTVVVSAVLCKLLVIAKALMRDQ